MIRRFQPSWRKYFIQKCGNFLPTTRQCVREKCLILIGISQRMFSINLKVKPQWLNLQPVSLKTWFEPFDEKFDEKSRVFLFLPFDIHHSIGTSQTDFYHKILMDI